jgi:hypothetical protein
MIIFLSPIPITYLYVVYIFKLYDFSMSQRRCWLEISAAGVYLCILLSQCPVHFRRDTLTLTKIWALKPNVTQMDYSAEKWFLIHNIFEKAIQRYPSIWNTEQKKITPHFKSSKNIFCKSYFTILSASLIFISMLKYSFYLQGLLS